MVICIGILGWSRVQAASSIPYYSVNRPVVDAFLSYEIESEKRNGQFTNIDKNSSTFKEKFDISTGGWVYHPALMVFNARLQPEFKQQKVDVKGGEAQANEATFLGYSVDTTFLQYKPYTVNLFANKSRNDFASSYSTDSAIESSTYRGQLFLKYDPVPTTITFESKDQVTESLFLTSVKTNKFRIDARHQTMKSKTQLEVENFEKITNVRATEFSGEHRFINLTNNSQLSKKSNLSSGLRFTSNTSGMVDSDIASFSSQLSVRHRDKLKTHYQMRIEDHDEGDFMSKKRFGAADLTHQLYENLTTILTGSIDENELTGGTLDAYVMGINFRYIRRIPWGNLTINLGRRERIEDDQRQLAFAEIRDESHMLTATDPVLLVNDVIDVGSIVVTDVDGFPYNINTDYIVTAVGNDVFIFRNIAGGIAAGEEVLVDYRFDADPPAKIETISQSFGVNLSLWSMLDLFYQKNESNEKFISGVEPSELADDVLQRAGAELRWKWSTTRVEVEDRDTIRTPRKMFRFLETLFFKPNHRMSLVFSGDYSKHELVDTGEELESTGVSVVLRRDFGGAGQFSADGFRQQTTGSAQHSDRKGLKLSHQFKYGRWLANIKYAFIDEVDQLVGESRNTSNLYFEVNRKF